MPSGAGYNIIIACATTSFAYHGPYSTWMLSCEYAAEITSCVAGEHFVLQLPEHSSRKGTESCVQMRLKVGVCSRLPHIREKPKGCMSKATAGWL